MEAVTCTSTASVLVEPYQEEAFKQRLAKLNRKAVTFGLEPITVMSKHTESFVREQRYVGRDADRLETRMVPLAVASSAGRSNARPHQLIRYTLVYPIVKLAGWRVLGRVEAAEGGNVIFAATTDDDATASLLSAVNAPIECAHCKTRRARRIGYLLRNESGVVQLVGSTCLEDFTGVDPSAALFLADMHSMVRICEGWVEEASDLNRRTNAVWTLDYIADVVFISRKQVFVSSTRARAMTLVPTYVEALEVRESVDRDTSLASDYWSAREMDRAYAQRILDWVQTLDGASSTFASNMKLLLGSETLRTDPSHLAFAAASYAAFAKHHAEQRERQRPSQHVGSAGDKLSAELLIERVVALPNPYGREAKHLVLLRDQADSAFAWRSTAVPEDVLAGEGRRMVASFTVSRHGEYRGVAQTTVTRLRVQHWLEARSEAEMQA